MDFLNDKNNEEKPSLETFRTYKTDINNSTVDIHSFQYINPTIESYIQTLYVVATDAEGSLIGRMHGVYINREAIKLASAGPWNNSSLVSHSIFSSSCIIDVFDDCGKLRPEYDGQNNGEKAGSGKWSTELDDGNIFVVRWVLIKPDYWSSGLSYEMFKILRARAGELGTGKGYKFGLVQFMPIRRIGLQCDSRKQRLEREAAALKWYRKLGHRKIGKSSIFGFATDEKHPSRVDLTAEEDKKYDLR